MRYVTLYIYISKRWKDRVHVHMEVMLQKVDGE